MKLSIRQLQPMNVITKKSDDGAASVVSKRIISNSNAYFICQVFYSYSNVVYGYLSLSHLTASFFKFPPLDYTAPFFTYMIISAKEILNYDFLWCDNVPLRNALTGKGNRYRKCGCLFMPQLFVSGPRFSWIMLLGQKCHRLIHSINCAVGSLVDNNLYL